MNCAKCGSKLKLGCIYCSICGQEAQIVPDYSLLEEELQKELLQDEKKKGGRNKADGPKKQDPKGKKNKKRMAIVISSICIVIAALAIILTIWLVQKKNENTFSYQYEKGQASLSEMNYVKAMEYFKRSLELDDTSVDVRWKIVETEIKLEQEDGAISMLHEIIDKDSSDAKAYEQLIALYKKRNDIDAILKLRDGVPENAKEILNLFSDYEVKEPRFSLEPGTYTDYITVELTAEEGCEIYYTLNGKDPAKEGSLYKEPFKLEKQEEISVRAVAKNSYQTFSEEVSGRFEVRFKKPKMPVVRPDGGSFTDPISITVDVPEGAKVYYTWDGSTPSAGSQEYMGPFDAPEGSNILSLILVDKYGMTSEVMKCNFKYMPQ